jgi:hypothetical protein
MEYHPRARSPKRAIRQYKKSLHEKSKVRKGVHRSTGRPIKEERPSATEREVSELTLKRLHVLGSQRFGSSPFSLHFNRWLANIEAVLTEFKSHPSIGVDDQFVMECQQTLTSIKLQLEERRHKETALEQEIKKLSDSKSRLKQIGIEYAAKLSTIRSRKNTEIKCLNRAIDDLKKQQEKVIQMKTGFFRGVSPKERERKEMAIAAELDSKLTKLELVLLEYSAKRKQLRSEYDTKIEPELKQLKDYQKKTQEIETDASLEERWFACEALIDAVNGFLQRKATQPH